MGRELLTLCPLHLTGPSGELLSRFRPPTRSLISLFFWLTEVLPEQQFYSPRPCSAIRVLNHTPRNSFLFLLCSGYNVSWMLEQFTELWPSSVWRVNCFGMHSATSASLHLPITPQCLVGTDNKQVSCHRLLFLLSVKEMENPVYHCRMKMGSAFGLGASKRQGSGYGPTCTRLLCLKNLPSLQSWPYLALSPYLPPAFVPPEVFPLTSLTLGPFACSCLSRKHDLDL